MLHRQVLLRAAFAVAVLIPAACSESSYNGSPGPSFLAGSAGKGATGKAGTSGQAGTYGSGGAGTTATGAAGTGAAGSGSKPQACTANGTTSFTMAWTIEDGAGAPSTCTSVAAKTVDLSIVSLTTGGESQATVPCAALSATTCALPAGAYSVSMKLRADTDVLAEIVAPQLFAVAGQPTPIASLPFRVGGPDAAMGRGIAATWTIGDDTETVVTCAAAGAAKVQLAVGTKTFDFPCAEGKGRTTTLAPGSYPVSLRLIDAQNKDLSVTQTMNIAVGAGQLVFLGDVWFEVL
jgi:hypothetical protein